MKITTFSLFASTLLLLPSSASAGIAVPIVFPSGSSSVIDNGYTSSPYCCFLDPGQGIYQTYTLPALTAVSQLDISIGIGPNYLWPGSTIFWDVKINGTKVGDWSWGFADGAGTLTRSYTFAPITNSGSFTLDMRVTGIGGGSIGVARVGSATFTGDAVPEPTTWLLCAPLLAAIAGRRLAGRRP